MNEQLLALQRVCDKRYARMMAAGKTEKEAADLIAQYLQGWLKEFSDHVSKSSVLFVESLLKGYLA